MKNYFQFITVILMSIGIGSCSNPKDPIVRTYQEIRIDDSKSPVANAPFMNLSKNEQKKFMNDNPEIQAMLSTAAKTIDIQWQIPAEWTETTDSASGIPTFQSLTHQDVLCKITNIQGDAGGVKANIIRWFKQLNIEITEVDQTKLNAFIIDPPIIKTSTNANVSIFDFTKWQTQENTQSIIAGILTTETQTIFIKMTGVKEALTSEKKNFIDLINSLNI